MADTNNFGRGRRKKSTLSQEVTKSKEEAKDEGHAAEERVSLRTIESSRGDVG